MSREREGGFDELGKKLKAEINGCSNSENMGRRHMVGPPGSLNTVAPCAACKLLRRRCAEDCSFYPYFSPYEPHKFAVVHKVFGASNVSKMLMEVPEPQRADAANSLVYEANVRLTDPVYGCMGAISALQLQIQTLEAELNAARAEIVRYKYREAANTIIAPPPPTLSPPAPVAAHPLLPLSIVVSSATSTPSMYASPSSNASYNSISNKHIPFFDN